MNFLFRAPIKIRKENSNHNGNNDYRNKQG